MHKIKTKEINTETEFGYARKNLHKLTQLSSQFSPKIRICVNSLSFLGVWICDETLFLVFHILRENYELTCIRSSRHKQTSINYKLCVICGDSRFDKEKMRVRLQSCIRIVNVLFC